MKRCKFNRVLISRFINKDLLTDQENDVEMHLSQCGQCRSVYEDYKAIGTVIRAYDTESSRPVFLHCKNTVRHPFIDRLLSPRFLFPASAFFTIAIIFNALLLTGNLFSGKSAVPVLSVNSSSSLMNTILGSIVYYEEYDTGTVQSQFFHLSPGVSDTSETVTSETLEYLTYNSPLFSDNDVELDFEESIPETLEK